MTAVYPGSFDPITLGHLNLIRRSSILFDHVIVLVMMNPGKTHYFSLEEREEQISRVITRFSNVSVDTFDGLLAEYVHRVDNPVLVKGLRALSDYEYEAQMAIINNKMNHKLETLFMTASDKYTYLSSTAVREMARYGADISNYVPREILADVKKKFYTER